MQRPEPACVGLPLVIFFPEEEAVERGPGNRRPGPAVYREAKAVCARCAVRGACLEAALAIPVKSDQDGVFGGLTATERAAERRRRGLAEAEAA